MLVISPCHTSLTQPKLTQTKIIQYKILYNKKHGYKKQQVNYTPSCTLLKNFNTNPTLLRNMRKCVVLCKGCHGIETDKIAKNVIGAEIKIFDSCEPDSKIATEELNYNMIVFGCPVLYHLSNYEGIVEIIDLRNIWGLFEKPEKVASALINSSIIFEIPDTEAIETGNKVIYYGDNLELISLLSEHLDVTVICDDMSKAEELFPFRTRVIKSKGILNIDGKIGDFDVSVKGYDLALNKEGVFTFNAGQLILPIEIANKNKQAGIYAYGNEYTAAIKAITNSGGFSTFKPVDILHGLCGASKSGYEGCKLCLACPHGSISYSKGEKRILISTESCKGCGFCAAICPVSAIKYNYLSSTMLFEKIESVLAINEGKLEDSGKETGDDKNRVDRKNKEDKDNKDKTSTSITKSLSEKHPIAFICEESLEELYKLCKNHISDSTDTGKKAQTILPAIVPCINCLNEVVYLYASLRGAKVVIIPHKDHRHVFKNLDIANKILKAFGLTPIDAITFEKLFESPNSKGIEKTPTSDTRMYAPIDMAELNGLKNTTAITNKRELLIQIIKIMSEHFSIKKPEIETDLFGIIQINNNCTACMACSYFCPSGAIKNEKGVIYFNHLLCIACSLCENACPENAISLSRLLDLSQTDRKEIYRDELIKCPSCGKEHIPKSMYEKLKAVGEYSILFCSECRPKVILEQIYEEATKGEKKNE